MKPNCNLARSSLKGMQIRFSLRSVLSFENWDRLQWLAEHFKIQTNLSAICKTHRTYFRCDSLLLAGITERKVPPPPHQQTPLELQYFHILVFVVWYRSFEAHRYTCQKGEGIATFILLCGLYLRALAVSRGPSPRGVHGARPAEAEDFGGFLFSRTENLKHDNTC